MKYQHRYHAGNFGDVFKHIALVDLLRRFTQKDKALFYLETHAGRGQYVLDGASPGEAAHGVLKVIDREPRAGAIRTWLDLIRRNDGGAAHKSTHVYPGSPRLAQLLLRAGDRASFFEIVPREAETLSQNLGPDRRLHIECGDGLQAIKALLPPRERRGLVLIDPAYERQEQELDEALDAIRAGLARWSTGTYCLWYPIKERRSRVRLERASAEPGWPPTLLAELCVYRDDTRVGLNGAGLMILNPPWQFDVALREWIEELHAILAVDRAARWSVEWLVPDR
ncbi:MAG: 23S rRNA (adenine(2030)-N(6))-methyltransferase RlmJ [Steroidobacteraceae bacterium]